MDRQCARPACSEPAAATLTYSYAKQVAWLDDLGAERDPAAHDLCERHADAQRVPSGWSLQDRRRAVAAPSPPPRLERAS